MRVSRTAALQFALRLVAAVFGFLALVYFGNVLGSAKLGTYTLTLSVAVWLWVVTDPGVTSALVKRVSEGEDRAEFFTAGLLAVAAVGGLVVAAVFLFDGQVAAYVGADVAAFVAALVVGKILFVLLTATISGHERVATASVVRFAERALRPALQTVAVFAGLGVVGLLSGYVASLAVGCLVAVVLLPVSLRLPGRTHFARLLSFAKFAVLKLVRSRAARWTDTAVLGFFVSNSLVGVYEVAWSLALLLILASDSLTQSLFPTLSGLASDARLERVAAMTESALAFTGVLVVPGVVGALLVGEDLLLLFGREFTDGVAVLPILVVWSLVTAYERVLRGTMDALDRPDLTFRADLTYVAANLFGNVALVALFGWVGAAVATAGATLLSFALAARYAGSLLDVRYPVGEILRQVLAAGVMALVVYPVHTVVSPLPRPYVVVTVAVGAASYLLALLALSTRVRKRVTGLLPAT